MNNRILPDLITAKAASKLLDMPQSTMRHYVRERKVNGLAPAVVKIGRRTYLNKALLFEWIRVRAGKTREEFYGAAVGQLPG